MPAKRIWIYGGIAAVAVLLIICIIWFTSPRSVSTLPTTSSLSSNNTSSKAPSSSFVSNSTSSVSSPSKPSSNSSSSQFSASSQSTATTNTTPSRQPNNRPPTQSSKSSSASASVFSNSSATTSSSSSASSSSIPTPIIIPPPFTGIVVPLYSYPGDQAYTNLIAIKVAHPAVPIIAIINTQGSDIQNNLVIRNAFITEANRLKNAGIKILGYVDSTYTVKPLDQFKNSSCSVGDCTLPGVTTYTANGIYIDGIFVDQVCSGSTFSPCDPSSITYYQSVYDYVRTTAGLSLLMTNQGTAVVDPAYYAVADLIVSFENKFSSFDTSLFAVNNPNASKDTVLIYESPTFVSIIQSLKNRVKYIYVTPDTLPNPWDTLPGYLGQLATALE